MRSRQGARRYDISYAECEARLAGVRGGTVYRSERQLVLKVEAAAGAGGAGGNAGASGPGTSASTTSA